ncbi:MAG: methyltransferase domain-containing protein [Treponema sp.]|jgi:2-polyprenyl-3-methyl-5-hydroxy-6-metoxy-1,4-benzoquinol methylase/spore coat polysaccharide biosynthesis predicted glycosyltransferase SpsG|nr:methyltransferase domain-containing protein [Treponema sp.]
MSRLKILIVPCVEKRKGGGHIARSLRLAQELRALGREAWVYVGVKGRDLGIGEEFIVTDRENDKWDVVILDRFRTPCVEFARWRNIAPIIGIDEGGTCRKRFDFLLDMLPNLERHKPNIANPGFLFPNSAWQYSGDSRSSGELSEKPSVIVTFGAEDAAGLTAPISTELLQRGFAVTAVFGALNQASVVEREKLREIGVVIWENVENLGARLSEFALVVTHYGLTAFESLYTRTPVLLVSPTHYHERLARKAGFLTARGAGSLLGNLSMNFQAKTQLPFPHSLLPLIENCRLLASKYRVDKAEALASFLAHIEIHGADCPICGAGCGGKSTSIAYVLARFPNRTYRQCPICRTVFMSRLTAPPVEYNRTYFFDAYKKQYGKTYLDDFSHLADIGRKRLVHIKKLHGAGRSLVTITQLPTLLDIGCAYGPFLVAAAEAGFAPVGLETAQDAASYVKNTLRIPCYNTTFPTSLTECFDVVTLWFVIEHFEETGKILAEINRLLKPKGVLAFSTPSLAGISARKSQKKFLENSPLDHYTVFDPRTIRPLLKKFGFLVKKTMTTGIHPERFPFFGKFVLKCPPLRAFLFLSSRLFRMGDTFEVYAIKEDGGNKGVVRKFIRETFIPHSNSLPLP